MKSAACWKRERTIRGRRDYAILLPLVTYGLRAHEVARLTLDDVDWKRERLQVLGRKAGHATVYPLAGVVAEAIIGYLKNGRPKTEDRHLFFRARAPQAPITPAAVSSSVALYLYKAGIQVPKAGSHTLRHTCVQRLIEAEFPLKTIGDYVGHRSPESTRVYIKVAIASLREVALLDVIGPEGHDASTWYCALLSAGNIPIASMIWLEGQSFHRFGAHGLLWTDAGANLIVFAIVALAFLTRGFSFRPTASR